MAGRAGSAPARRPTSAPGEGGYGGEDWVEDGGPLPCGCDGDDGDNSEGCADRSPDESGDGGFGKELSGDVGSGCAE